MTGWRKRQIADGVSPFEWKKNKEPTVFAKDPTFKAVPKLAPTLFTIYTRAGNAKTKTS